MKKIFLGTNWKMHKTAAEAEAYTNELVGIAKEFNEFQIFIIPPYTDLWQVRAVLKNSTILLGAQNMHWENEGAYTGEISPLMLKEIGIDLIELGHSERRQYYHETDYTVNNKVLAGLACGFITLVCIGEQLDEKKYGVSREIIAKQLKIALYKIPAEQTGRIWISYEPVWAIGEQGIPAEPSYISEIHTVIRNTLTELYGAGLSQTIPILYGGSVNLSNSVNFIKQPNVDGLFIGRAAWNAQSFHDIMKAIRATTVQL